MANNSFKINKSVNFNPQSGLPGNPVDGDFFYDAVAQSFAYYHNGAWANFDSVGAVAASEPLTAAQFTSTIIRNSVVRITGGVAPIHLYGFTAGFSAKTIKIYNAGSSYITVGHENAGESVAANRIRTPTAGDMNLIAGEIATFTYDIIANRWLLVSISSQAGAQIIATTTNPGIVTLHQASTIPANGIVLSDGDLNTANGVVGLDANRTASITALAGNNTALTLTGTGSGYGLRINAGGAYLPAGDILFDTTQQIKWGAITYITGVPDTGIQAILSTNGGNSYITIERASSSIVQIDLHAFATLDGQIQLDTSIALAPKIRIGSTTANSSIVFGPGNADRWGIDPSGHLISLAAGSGKIYTNTAIPLTLGYNSSDSWKVEGSAFESLNAAGPVILRSPNNTRYAVTVTNAGALSVAPA